MGVKTPQEVSLLINKVSLLEKPAPIPQMFKNRNNNLFFSSLWKKYIDEFIELMHCYEQCVLSREFNERELMRRSKVGKKNLHVLGLKVEKSVNVLAPSETQSPGPVLWERAFCCQILCLLHCNFVVPIEQKWVRAFWYCWDCHPVIQQCHFWLTWGES